MHPVALTIAGSDPSGGAGIQADLKTFHQFGVYGEAVITLLTVQNTQRVERVECMDPELVAAQIAAVCDDIPPLAAKTGALGTAEVVRAVARAAERFTFPLVVDPVMVSKHGLPLVAADALAALAHELLPRAFLVTPNVPEAAQLAGMELSDVAGMRLAAEKIAKTGSGAVLVKGGHLSGEAVDVFYHRGEWREFRAPRLETRHTHGTGCTYSAAITASLALGLPLERAIERAKRYIHEAIRTNPGLGRGCGPVNHHARP